MLPTPLSSLTHTILRHYALLQSSGRRLFAAARLRRGLVLALAMTAAASTLGGRVVDAQQTCPCSIWSTSTVPGPMDSEATALELGVKFQSDVAGTITGIRFYKYSTNTGTHVGNLWSSTGTLMGTATFTNETASGWQTVTFGSPIAIAANTTYVASYHTNTGHYAANSPDLSVAVNNAPLHALASNASGGNGVYAAGATSVFPTNTFAAGNYWVDVVFMNGTDSTPPTVSSVNPANGATGVGTTASVTAVFSEAMTASTITTATVTLKDPSNTTVPATVSYNGATLAATLTPGAPLSFSTTYTATITGGASGVKDSAGNALVANFSWSFTTAASTAVCPCSIWSTSTTPGPVDSEAAALELGVKFQSDTGGWITGLRFYKYSTNTGTHVGNLWSSTGTLMGTATFTNETASGWQTVTFGSPIAIAANTTYVASYHTNTGHYASNSPDLSVAVNNPPLHALASGASGGNGVYAAGATSVFPTNSFSAGNYWVDVIFNTVVDLTPPTVTAVTPANGASGVATNATVTATFSEAMTASTITATTVTLKNPSNVTVAATVSYNAATLTATLTPTAALANSTTYTATVTGGASGVKDASGNALASNFIWSFTTAADTTPPTVTAVSPASGATGVAVGTTVTATFSEAMTASTITSSTVTLKNPSNVIVPATVSYNATTFVATLTPSAPLANLTVYTATVTSGASGVQDTAGNALATDRVWSFTTAADTTPPTVTLVTPANGTTGVAGTTAATAKFSEAMNASTITATTVTLKNPSNVTVAATVTYDAVTFTATLTPTATLASSTTYTGTVTGGASGVKDAAGNALASNFTWSFTTAADTTPPTVTSVTPLNGATGVAQNTTVTATFSEALTASTVTTSTVTLKDPANNIVAATVSYNAATFVATLTPTTPLVGSTIYTGTITGGASGVKDVAGNALASNFTWTFTTVADLTPPTVTVVAPVNGATGVAQNTAVTATFSEPMNASTITASTVTLRDPSNATIAATVSYNATTFVATLTPSVPLASLTAYTATVTGGAGGVKDTSNNALAADFTWSFTTVADTFPPTVTLVTPASGATGVVIGTVVTAKFSESMTASTITATTVTLKNPSNVTVAATVAYNAATLVATLTPSAPLAYLTTYTATVTGGASGVKDTAGNALASNFTWSFTTAADTTPPTVTAVTPANGATGIAQNSALTATFSEAMTASTISTSTVTLKDPSNATIAATVSYNATTFVATLTPTTVLVGSTVYTATITGGASGVKDSAGNALASNFTWTFTTVADVTPPTVTAVTPSNGATGVAQNTTVTATFSEPMLASSITASTIVLKDPSNVTVAATVTYNATTFVATLTPTAPLLSLTTYTATVVGGASGVKDTSNNGLSINSSWSFTTVADTTPPTVTQVTPASGATGVAVATTVTAKFSEAMTASTITTATISLKDSANNVVAATVSYSAATLVATLAPTAPLAFQTTYTATVTGGASGVKDAAGNALTNNFTWTFTTLADTTPPTVTVVAPTNGATGVLVGASVTATFSEAMNASTISATTVTLKNASNVTVFATVSYNAATFVATLTPVSPLSYLTTYTATVTGGASGVKDAAGNALASNFTWTFTTSADTFPPVVSTVTPANGLTGVPVASAVAVAFNEGITASTITTATVFLKDPSNVTVPAAVSYNAATFTATLTPTGTLAFATTYTVTVKSGASGVKDLVGNALATDFTSTFTTATSPNTCPCTVWSNSTTPGPMSNEAAALELGVKFTADVTGNITGLRFYKYAPNTGTHIGSLWNSAGQLLGTLTFANETAEGWQEASFATPVAITANTTYVASYHTDTGFYAANSPDLLNGVNNPPLHLLPSSAPGGNGVFAQSATSTFPTNTFNSANYWVDVVFNTGADLTPPTVTSVSPANGATGVPRTATVTATFSEPMLASSIATSSVVLRDPTNVTIAATVTYNAATQTATLTPTAQLANQTVYTATVVSGSGGVRDAAGNPLQTDFTWSFTTIPDTTAPTVTAVTPLNGATGVAQTASVTATFSEAMSVASITTATVIVKDPSNATVAATISYNTTTFVATLTPSVQLVPLTTYTATVIGGASGVKDAAGNPLVSNFVWSFTTSADTLAPTVTGVSPANSATNVAIATNVTATFSEAINATTLTTTTFALKNSANVTIAATVTYNAATFTATLIPSAALAYSTTYTATLTGGASGVKDAAGNALAANFAWSFTTMADTTPPTITGNTPAGGATNVAVATTVTATFSEGMLTSSLTTSTIQLKDPNNVPLAATITYNATTFTATLTPTSALAYSTTYTAVVNGGSSGVKDAAGNALVNNLTWTFTTAAAGFTCPCSVWTTTTTPGPQDSEVNTLELGMKFKADVAGYATGVRFYKYSNNTGTHIGSLWSSTGTQLASVTFTNETASGWQSATFSPPVALAANTTYVISYHTNTGRYAATGAAFTNQIDNAPLHVVSDGSSGGNGVFAQGANSTFPNNSFNATNYWVDVVFTLVADTTPPIVNAVTPANGTTFVALTSPATATFSEAMNASTITTSTVVLRNGSTTIPSTVAYNAGTQTLTLTPSAALAFQTVYTVTISGGSSGVKDLAGNALATNFVWSFTTTPDTSGPAVVSANPPSGSTTVPINVPITVTFDKVLTASTVNAGITLKDATNTLVASTVTYDASTKAATLTPAAWLASGASYTVTVIGGASGVKDINGYAMPANVSWSFTTGAAGCPCSIWTLTTPVGPMATDLVSQELGVKFQADVDGSITGLRFYKYASNTGTHTGHLWTSTGTLLGSVTFASESASGWQQAFFTTPVPITANTMYVASYHTDAGFYAATANGLANAVNSGPLHALAGGSSGGNGVFGPGSGAVFPTSSFNNANYWVDVVFTTGAADTAPPWVTGTAPATSSMGVSTVSAVTATFSEPVDATTVTSGNFALRTSTGSLVSAAVSYNAANWTATLTPTAALASGSTYTATVTTGIRDTAGNSMTLPTSWSFTTAAATVAPTAGSGGPILVVTSTSNPFSQYYPEILRAEGFNEFNVLALTSVTASVLASYDVVILGEQTLTAAQVTTFTNWVQGGGNLITFRPDKKLAALLGLATLTTTSSNVYMTIDATQAPGTGIVSQSMQFHGTADQYTLAGARAVATIYSDAATPTAFPAVTLFTNGLGQAAAFTYDLARSVVQTRQGNPAWAGTERDGQTPIRSDDMFFGAKTGDVQPDWVDFNKIQIPQADEQQRLLANLILLMNADKKPLPRFWYLPQGRKAAVVMTGDDHAVGTVAIGRFSTYVSQSPNTCVVENWDCVRATMYVYPISTIPDAQVATWLTQGFEVGVHGTMDTTWQGCGNNFTATSLANRFTTEMSQFQALYPSAPAPTTHRMHCIMWSDWSTMATTELSFGMRLDTTYYYWPGTWLLDRPGLFTGSGMPMRYAASTGAPIDVYQATTQMTDESSQSYPLHINTLLDNALGATGYYGVFTANIHTDSVDSQPMADSIVNAARTRGVAVVTAKQMLTWLDGRNASAFGSIGWSGNALSFNVVSGTGTNGLQVMIPAAFGTQTLTGITLNAAPVGFTTQTIKGVTYAFVTVAAGQYVATYSAP